MRNAPCFLTALMMVVSSSPARAQGTFVPLGVGNTYVTGMSADGTRFVKRV